MSDIFEFDSRRDPISALVRSAGRRQAPPRETTEAVYLTALFAWRRAVRRRRLRWSLAAAAVLAVALAGVAWWRSIVPQLAPVAATVARSTGCPQLSRGAPLAVGQPFELEESCRVALDVDGLGLRLAASARGRFTRARMLRLEHGSAYFDSRGAAALEFVITTPHGRVTHVGTQFAAEVSVDGLAVKVRSGEARIVTRVLTTTVAPGEAVRIGADGRELERWPVPTSGEAWAWADALAPALELEGRSLAEVLADIARESGRLVQYESEEVRALCRATLLHGPPVTLPVERTLDAVLASTGLDARIEGDRMLIRRSGARPIGSG